MVSDEEIMIKGRVDGRVFELTIEVDGARLLAEAVIDLLDHNVPLVGN